MLHGARKVLHGAKKVSHSARKVLHSAGKVLHGAGKVSHRLLHPQHLDGIWSGLTPYRLPLDTLSEYPEP